MLGVPYFHGWNNNNHPLTITNVWSPSIAVLLCTLIGTADMEHPFPNVLSEMVAAQPNIFYVILGKHEYTYSSADSSYSWNIVNGATCSPRLAPEIVT